MSEMPDRLPTPATLDEALEQIAQLKYLLHITTPAIAEVQWRLGVTALVWFDLRADGSPWPMFREEPM